MPSQHLQPFSWRAPWASSGKRALLVDRDGVINRKIDGGYVLRWEQLDPLAGFVEAAAPISAAGLPIVIVTNQSCVGRGLADADSIWSIMYRTVSYLKDQGVRIAGFVCCPHAPKDGCSCRKPEPGLLFLAERTFGIDLAQSVFIGDSVTDYEAGTSAGVRTLLVHSDKPALYREAFASAKRMLLREPAHALA